MMTTPHLPCPSEVPDAAWLDLVETVTMKLRIGFTPFDHAVQLANDLLLDEEVSEDDAFDIAHDVVEELWEIEDEQQSTWNDGGDSAKLDQAFAVLEREGIIARMNFTCCQTCGNAEIDEERYGDTDWKGYVFFHSQDADRLLDDDSTLLMSFGAFMSTAVQEEMDRDSAMQWYEDHASAIAWRTNEIMQTEGLQSHWEGDTGIRISVDIANWQRKLP